METELDELRRSAVVAGCCTRVNKCLTCQEKPETAAKSGCIGIFCVGLLAVSVIISLSVRNLGPEDQLIVVRDGKEEVINGPSSSFISPFVSTTSRTATRLPPREYAIVQNQKT